MKKSITLILILSLIPNTLLAQSFLDKLPQEVLDTINSTPGAKEELEKTYNTTLDISSTGVEEQISFSVTPSVPRPGQLVTAKIASYSSDLNRLQISWYINDILVKKEIGATEYQFTMGELGKQTRLRIVITKLNGEILEKNYSFRPAEVDLIYEAQTFTPPFYEGKSYFSRQSDIKVVAMPQALDSSGNYIPPDKLSYKWYLDGSVVQNQSGYGKQTFNYKGGVLDSSIRVGVEISTIADGAVANTTININPINPEVLVYEKNPTLGTLYNKVIAESFSNYSPEVEFEAVPYFFNKELVLNRSTIYNWKLNGSKINSPNINSIVFRNENNDSGNSSIGITVSNSTLLQNDSYTFNLIFGPKKTNDFQF